MTRGISIALSLLKIVYQTSDLLLKPTEEMTITTAASHIHTRDGNCSKKIMNIHSQHGLWLCTGLTLHQHGGYFKLHS